MAGNVDHEALTLNLLEFIPGATAEQATQYLSANNWDLDAAAASLMADMEEAEADAAAPAASSSASQPAPPEYTGPRTLDGRPAPQYASSSSSKKPAQQKKKGLATLSTIGGGPSHDHDDDDSDDDDDDDRPRDTYAGGEKSGLAVQDPSQRGPDSKRIMNELFAKAKSQAQRRDAASSAGPSTSASFRGTGHTLGGEGVESRAIPDPLGPTPGRSQPAANVNTQTRTLHQWTDGFSIDDGPLLRYDDPANADALRMIQQGRAPIHLMNVRNDEPLDVMLNNHNEAYHPLPKIYKPFSGEGRRLGNPVPGDGNAAVATAPAAGAPSAPATGAPAQPANEDDGEPKTRIRIRYLDGTTKSVSFKLTQTIGDVYEFVRLSEPQSVPWDLFVPNFGGAPIEFKTEDDKKSPLEQIDVLKRGGVMVMKKK